MFQNPFSFEGRIRRLEYGLSILLYFLYIIAAVLILLTLGFIDETESKKNTLSIYLACSPAIYFMITQSAKRCHDRGNSGWWQLIPLYGFLLLMLDSEVGDNAYGPNPKGLYYDTDDESDTAKSSEDFEEK